MRRVRAPGGEVDKPRLGRVLGAHRVQPLDRLVGHVVGEVVLLAVLALRHPDRLVVLGDDRVPLAGLTAQEAPEVVKAPPVRPPVERARRALLPIGCQVPLAERGRAVPVPLQHLRERRAVLRNERRIPGEAAGKLADRAETDGMVVAAGQQRRPGRRAQRRHMEPVVPDTLLSDPGHGGRGDRAAERTRLTKTRIIDQHQQHIRRALRRRHMPDQAPVRPRTLQRPVHHTSELRVRDRQPGPVDPVISHGAPAISYVCLGQAHARDPTPQKHIAQAWPGHHPFGVTHDPHSQQSQRARSDCVTGQPLRPRTHARGSHATPSAVWDCHSPTARRRRARHRVKAAAAASTRSERQRPAILPCGARAGRGRQRLPGTGEPLPEAGRENGPVATPADRPAPATPDAPGPPDPVALLRSRNYVRLLVLAAILGVPIAAVAYGFLALVSYLQKEIFTHLPHGLGFSHRAGVVAAAGAGGGRCAGRLRHPVSAGQGRALSGGRFRRACAADRGPAARRHPGGAGDAGLRRRARPGDAADRARRRAGRPGHPAGPAARCA